jgi:amino acid adenylation domain-containing protein
MMRSAADPQAKVPAPGLAEAVRLRALRTPQAVAVVDGATRLDYAALDAAAAQVAAQLRHLGVRPGESVAVMLPRSWQLICVMLGILRLGAVVVPLDAQSPAQRRAHILADSASSVVVHGPVMPEDLPVQAVAVPSSALLTGSDTVLADEVPFHGAPVSFVFYTSGTTGVPKGVEVPEAGILRLAQPGYIRLTEGMRFACLSNPAFDALSFEVWVPLLIGGCCVILSDEAVQTPHALAEVLRRERIDTMFITVALFNAVIDAVPDCFAGVGQVLMGGEQLNAHLVRRWYRDNAASGTQLYNVYGPTESTTFALSHPIPVNFDGAVVPIGTVLPETGAVLVARDEERTARPGEVAELLLSGAGLASGYRNLPEETTRRFVRLGWFDGGRELFYRTGDLVRSTEDGLIEYVGRSDRQVKVRGFRIEPGEVERQLTEHPAVRQAFVCPRRVGGDGPYELLAYLVVTDDASFGDIDDHLAAHLPKYMRPHHLFRVQSLPLNANGKVDQAELLGLDLPTWRPDDGPPQDLSGWQREVLDLAGHVLGNTQLRLNDQWIAAGGDSLKALRLRFEMRRRWGCELTPSQVLRSTLGEIAQALASALALGSSYPPVPAPAGADRWTATSEQQRLWLLQQRAPRSCAYNVGLAFRIEGPVDASALREALRAIVARHPALRTAFEATADGLVQSVGASYDPWAELPPTGDGTVRAIADAFFAEPFDLAEPRMLRASLLPEDGAAILLLHLHHIAVDGWSLNVLFDDLSTTYLQAIGHRPALEPPRAGATPLDFAAWQQAWHASGDYQRQRDALRSRLADFTDDGPLPPRAGLQEPGRAQLLVTSLDAGRLSGLDRLSAQWGLTRFQLLLGVYAWSLYGVTGHTRLRIAGPVANRPVQEFENSVGMFANTVLLPLTVDPREDLRSEILRLADTTRTYLDHQDVALADAWAAPQAGQDTPFDYLFVLENTEFGSLTLPNCVVRPLWWAPAQAKCPLTLSVVEQADGLDCLWESAAGHFSTAQVEAMAQLFLNGVDALVAGRAWTPAALAGPYRRSLPEVGRGASMRLEWETVTDGFARQVHLSPDAPALRTGELSVTYAQLDQYAAALAGQLQADHPLPSSDQPACAVLYLEPSVEHVVALLALARLNVTIMPLDPAYPRTVLRQALKQLENPLCVLVAQGQEQRFDAVDPDVRIPRHEIVLPHLAIGPSPVIGRPGSRPLYTLFTSGSTGVPKGVQVSDRTLCNLLQWQAQAGGLGQAAATQQFSMLSFDVSFQEIFATLCGGGLLHLVRPQWRHDPEALLTQLEENGIRRLYLPYVALQLLAEHAVHLGRYPSQLREVITAGEQLVCTNAIRQWCAGMPGVRLFNHYGPSETHVVSSLCLEGDPLTWPDRPAIGRPVANAVLQVVDEADQMMPVGHTGELLIGGAMVERCYLGDTALNDERFVEVPGRGLFYRSGDRACADSEGLVHYAGRGDDQVKLSGHRLELGQVEAALLKHPSVVNAMVVREGEGLTACLQCRGSAPTMRELADHLADLLPSFVRVDRFRLVPELPRTPSGKLDRRAALRSPGQDLVPAALEGARADLSPLEAKLVQVLQETTGTVADVSQSFFDAGVSSLGLMRFQLRCTAGLGLHLSVADLFEHGSIRALARFLERGSDMTESTAAGAEDQAASTTFNAAGGDEPIAVIGMATRLPGAATVAEFWQMVQDGGRGMEEFTASDLLVGVRSQMDGLLDFDPGHFGISRHDARLMDPQQRHLLMACVQALAHAGIADVAGHRVGLVASAGENTYFQDLLRTADPAQVPDTFQLALHHDKDFLATKVAYHLGLTGPAFSAQSACSSSLLAVHLATALLRQGDAEIMLAGGVLVDTTLTGGYQYRPQHIFSVDGHCRPFSDDASGTVGASGVGVVVLKPLRLARRDGDTVYAVITGSAVNNDGSDKLSYSAPSVSGQREVIRAALRRSGRTGADLGYVEAHGTGTRLGDPVEVAALRQAFDVAEAGRCALSSVKSQIGHLGAAAGVVGLIRAVLAVHHAVIPPNIDFRAINPQIGPDPTPFYIPTQSRPWPVERDRVAAVSSFGVGGTNVHVILQEAPPATPPAPVEAMPCVMLSASSAAALQADAARIAAYLETRPETYRQVLRHLQAGRRPGAWRMTAFCPTAADAVAWLRSATPVAVPASETGEGTAVDARGAETVAAKSVARDWLAGAQVTWPHGGAQAPWDFPPPSFDLAEYAFQPVATTAPELAKEPAGPQRLPEAQWLLQPQWARLHRAPSTATHRSSRLLVLMTARSPQPEAVRTFTATYDRVIRVQAGNRFTRHDADSFEVDPADLASLRLLVRALAEEPCSGVDWLHALALEVDAPVGPQTLEQARWACLDTVAAVTRAVSEVSWPSRPRMWWLSHRALPVDGPVLRPELGLLAGASTVTAQEHPVDSHWLDVPGARLEDWAAHVAALLAAAAVSAEGSGNRLALRQGYWWHEVPQATCAHTPAPDLPRSAEGVHLVLGGTGGIGAAIASWLLEHTSGRVLLVARRARLPQSLAQWADRVTLIEADLARIPAIDLMDRIRTHAPTVDSVVHAVGEAAGGMIRGREPQGASEALAGKLAAALLVEELISRHRPALAVYCSSMSAQFGGIGQFDYAAANGVLDAFAAYRAHDEEATTRVSIGWDVWNEAGMALRVARPDARHRAHLAVGLSVEEGTRVFARAIGLGLPNVMVSTTPWDTARTFFSDGADSSGFSGFPEGPSDVESLISDRLRDWLGVDSLDRDASLYDLGADSLTLLDMISEVKRHSGIELDLSQLSHQVSVAEVMGRLGNMEGSAGTGRPLVPVEVWQEGTGVDVLCLIHPVGGDIQAYRSLVGAVDPQVTVCLIADPALRDPSAPSWTLTQRAHHYLTAFRERFQGQTWRCQLAGWSFGAWVALGMAAEAEQAGDPVAAVHLLDPPPPSAGPRLRGYDESQLETVFAHELEQRGTASATLLAHSYAEQLARCCRTNLQSMHEHQVPQLFATHSAVWLANQPVTGLPSLGSAAEQKALWQSHLASPDVRPIDTTHYGIVRSPFVEEVVGPINTLVRRTVAPSAPAREKR